MVPKHAQVKQSNQIVEKKENVVILVLTVLSPRVKSESRYEFPGILSA
jgi:hypothetical protein